MDIWYIFVTSLLLGVCIHLTEGEFQCFKRFRKKRQQCSGPIPESKMHKYNTPEKCCAKRGQGYSYNGLDPVRKNRFVCISCTARPRPTTTERPTVSTTPAPWGRWGPCSTSCGAGWRSRYRNCIDCDTNHFNNVQSEPCIENFYCPVNGNWGPWQAWQPCTQSCDGGVRRRERRCNYPSPTHGGRDCEGDDHMEEPCNEQECPVDGGWSRWSEFTVCSTTCGRGTMVRTRACNSPEPSGGGRGCRGSSSLIRSCERRRCPQHGGWSTWESWSECPVTCGTGIRVRLRKCNRPRPMFGGRDCDGSNEAQEPCRVTTHCPIDGSWSTWTYWGSCQAPRCGRGFQLRSRACNNPRPRHRGRMCPGSSVDRRVCVNDENCPVTGVWCGWSEWSPCTATCSDQSSTQIRERTCDCPAPKNGGLECAGEDFAIKACQGVPRCNDIVIRQGVESNSPEVGVEEEQKETAKSVVK